MQNLADCTKMHQGKRLEALLEEKKLKVTALARFLEKSRNQVYEYFKKETLHFSVLAKAAEFLEVPVSEFLSESELEDGSTYAGNVKSVEANFSELYTHIAFLSARAQAGNPTMSFENCELKLDETYPVFVPTLTLTKRHLVIEIVGDSMEPSIVNGAIVLAERVAKDDIKYESGAVYAVMYANRFVVKRIKTNDLNTNGTLTLWSDNERFGHITIRGEDINCMWKVLTKVYEPVR